MSANRSLETIPPRVLVLLAEGFEEIEAITPIDLLRRAGAEVTIAALTDELNVTGRCGIAVRANVELGNLTAAKFDCLLLPGGPGVRHLRADPRVRMLVLSHAGHGSWIAAICAAPTVLLDAGLLNGRRHTAHPSVSSELPKAETSQRVVVDGRLVTSRGAGTALDFGLILVEKLFSADKSAEIARSICA
jgi:4-methyl-5(b-hydroxyethyl)-thiazole monophosphate biosynthesis